MLEFPFRRILGIYGVSVLLPTSGLPPRFSVADSCLSVTLPKWVVDVPSRGLVQGREGNLNAVSSSGHRIFRRASIAANALRAADGTF